MSTSLDLLRKGSKQVARRSRSADRRRRPVLERLEDLLLMANNVLVVTTTAPTGGTPGSSLSLDQAIRDANTSGVATTIEFNIPGTGPQTIMVGSGTGSLAGSRFQTIHVPIFFDGWSEGNFQQNGTSSGTYQGPPLIVIDGTHVTSSDGAGLDFEGPSSSGPGSQESVVQGLDIVNYHFNLSNFSGGTGIEIEATATDITLQGNYVGVGPDGKTPEGNDVIGVGVMGSGNIIGGTSPGDGNVIAGNGNNPSFLESEAAGVLVTGSNHIIQGNDIGVASDGTTAVGNNIGMLLEGRNNTIGGLTSSAANVISGNNGDGIFSDGDIDDTIQGNLIGTDAGGTQDVHNQGDGIDLTDGSSGDLIGSVSNGGNLGSGNGANTIAFNAGSGVNIGSSTNDTGSVGNDIEGNSITANAGLGISLGAGTTPIANDSLGHSGPNHFQNYPILTSVTVFGGNATITGSFTQTDEPHADLTINFYGDPGDPSHFGQGAVFLGSTSFTTDTNRYVQSFTATVNAPPAGDMVSATATLTDFGGINVTIGDTSEFSNNVTPPAPLATTTTLASSANPSNYPDSVTFTATVTSQTVGTPTGDVTFSIDGTAQTPVMLTDVSGVQTATFEASSLGGGQHTITATYDGDSNFATSPAPPVTQVVNLNATTTSISSSQNPSTYGDTVTFTATVNPQISGTPTGTVMFFDGQTFIGSASLEVIGDQFEATLLNSTLTGGSHTINAGYSGDANFAPSATTTPVIQVVNPASTTTTINSSANPSRYGDSVTFTATITPDPSAVLPTGTVTFSIDFTAQTPVPVTDVRGQAVATFSDAGLTGGHHTITATYNGDTNYTTSTATTPVTQVVNPAPTTTSVDYSANPSFFGETVTFIASVTSVAVNNGTFVAGVLPTGSVTFSIDGTAQTPVPALGFYEQAVATFPDSTLAVGSHTITATYNGDTNYTTSTAPTPVPQAVQAVTSITFNATPNPANAGQTVNLLATVSGSNPTGTVSFLEVNFPVKRAVQNASLGTAPLNANDQASLPLSTLEVGTNSILAIYSGDADNLDSSSTIQGVVVNALPSTTTISSAPTATTVGQAATFAVVIAGTTGGPTPTGTVTLLANSKPIGTAPVTNGQASFTISTLGAGTQMITAAYSGDTTYAPSTSAVAALTVAKAASTTLVSSTANPSVSGQAGTFTAVVSGSTAATPPTGTVTFLDGTTVLGTATLTANGVARFTTSTLPVGTQSITASYSGDANFLASTSTALTQQINSAAVVTAPTVTNLQRFGFHAQPTILVLTFRGPLNAATAEDTANYTVTGAAGTFVITSAVYNPANNTVTLLMSQFLNVHHRYTITVNGMAPSGVASNFGVLLDGANHGQPGSNYVKTFGMEILAGADSAASSPTTALTLGQIDHGHFTDRVLDEVMAEGRLPFQRHKHGKH